MPQLTPSNPSEVMLIRKVTPNITVVSSPFWRFGQIKIGGRATIGVSPVAHRDLVIIS